MKIFLPKSPAPKQLTEIEALRGAFRNGHTDDDARRVLACVARHSRTVFAILWTFHDCWGLGGNSQLIFVDSDGRLREAPDQWRDFLYEPTSTVAVGDLFALRAGNVIRRSSTASQFGDHNYAWRSYSREAPLG